MIGKLSGTIDTIEPDHILLDVNGIGFTIYMAEKNLRQLITSDTKSSFFIETIVRQDGIFLYGFTELEQKTWFKNLLNVQGVGSKAALSILNILEPQALIRAINDGKKELITQAEGVGPKIASRILIELKDKAKKLEHTLSISPSSIGNNQSSFNDALLGLTHLGYRQSDIMKAFNTIKEEKAPQDYTVQDIIRQSLAILSRK